MKKGKKFLLVIFSTLLILWGILFVISHIVYRRSVMATLFEWFISAVNPETTEAGTAEQLAERKQEKEPVYTFQGKVKSSVTQDSFQNLDIYTLNKEDSYPILIYIHGGAYVSEIMTFQWRMMDKIAQKSNCEVRGIIYPLAPWHTWEESYESITDYYVHVRKENPSRPVFLCGDSAGGGLALGIAINIAEKEYHAPDGLILLSPWVNAAESDFDSAAYEAVDPLLSPGQLRASAQTWAGDEPLEDWHISPINGDLAGLHNVHIFVGTRELFYPDNVLLYEKLEDLKIECSLTVQPGMNHVYPMFPIPEAAIAYRQIASIINAE